MNYKNRYSKGMGWFNESYRHSLARRGIKTSKRLNYSKNSLENDVKSLVERAQKESLQARQERIGFSKQRRLVGKSNFVWKLPDGSWKWEAMEYEGNGIFYGKVTSPITPQGEYGTWYMWDVENNGGVLIKGDHKVYQKIKETSKKTQQIQKEVLGWSKKEGLDLKDPTHYKFGSVTWQNVMLHNIREKMRNNEELSDMEKTFIKIQGEHFPKGKISYQQVTQPQQQVIQTTYLPTTVSVQPTRPTFLQPTFWKEEARRTGADIKGKVIGIGQELRRRATPEAGWIGRGIEKEKEFGKKVVRGAGRVAKGFLATVALGLAGGEEPYIYSRPKTSVYQEKSLGYTNNPLQPIPPHDKDTYSIGYTKKTLKKVGLSYVERLKKVGIKNIKDLANAPMNKFKKASISIKVAKRLKYTARKSLR